MFLCIYTNNKEATHLMTFDSLRGVANFLFQAEHNNKNNDGAGHCDYKYFLSDLIESEKNDSFPYTWVLKNNDFVIIIPQNVNEAGGGLKSWAEKYAKNPEMLRGTNKSDTEAQIKSQLGAAILKNLRTNKEPEPVTSKTNTFIVETGEIEDEEIGKISEPPKPTAGDLIMARLKQKLADRTGQSELQEDLEDLEEDMIDPQGQTKIKNFLIQCPDGE